MDPTKLRELADELFKGPCADAVLGVPCLERIRKVSRTTFDRWNPDKMCLDCRCYWRVEVAAQEAERAAGDRSPAKILAAGAMGAPVFGETNAQRDARDPKTEGRKDLAVREQLDALQHQIDDLIDWIDEVEHDADTANECRRILAAAIGRAPVTT